MFTPSCTQVNWNQSTKVRPDEAFRGSGPATMTSGLAAAGVLPQLRSAVVKVSQRLPLAFIG